MGSEMCIRDRDSPGWEQHTDALARFDAAVADVADAFTVITTHGTVLALWLSTQIADVDPVPFWLDLKMPDAWLFDPAQATVTRLLAQG